MTSEGGVFRRDPSTGLEEALADNASLRRHASSVAHDFNNLLSVITGYTEMILRRLRRHDLALVAGSVHRWSAAHNPYTEPSPTRQTDPACRLEF